MTTEHASVPDSGHAPDSGHKKNGRRHLLLWWHLGQWDAQVYGALVGLGVPAMGFFIEDHTAKLIIVAALFGLTPFYWFLELAEIRVQIQLHGLLSAEETSHQRQTMMFPIYGIILALVIWGFGIVGGWRGPSYEAAEWAILIHTAIVSWSVIHIMFPLIDNYLQATSGQRRFEE